MKFLHFHGVQPVFETTYNVGPGLFVFEQHRRYRFMLEVPSLIKEPSFAVQLVRTDGHHYYETQYGSQGVSLILKQKMDTLHHMLGVSFNTLSSKHNHAVFALKVLLKTDITDEAPLVLYTAHSPNFIVVNCAQAANGRMKRMAFEVLREGMQLDPGSRFKKQVRAALQVLAELKTSNHAAVLSELVESLRPEEIAVFQQISHLLELKQQPLFISEDPFHCSFDSILQKLE